MPTTMSSLLPCLLCPVCHSTLSSTSTSVRAATTYEDCLRKCDPCGIGFSNARTSPTLIYRSPEYNVPDQVRSGVLDVLGQALNVRNRPQKLVKFGFSTSEDALTWTVFRYLQQSGQLASVFGALGVIQSQAQRPTALFWGVPWPMNDQAGQSLRDDVISICNTLDEKPLSRSEPDLILNFGDAGIVFIEVKYRSSNISEVLDQRCQKYQQNTSAFTDMDALKRSGFYELIRNWRIGFDLADGRPYTLVNLVQAQEENSNLSDFRSGLCSGAATFKTVLWRDLLSICTRPDWVNDYLRTRGLEQGVGERG
jgi:hypothetical protein